MEIVSTLLRCCGAIVRTGIAAFGEQLKDTDLDGKDALYVLSVCQYPGLSQEMLTRYVNVDKSNVTRNLVSLGARGYVERRRGKTDTRVIHVFPTDRSYELLPRLYDILTDWQATLTQDMSVEETELITELCERMERNALHRDSRYGENDER